MVNNTSFINKKEEENKIKSKSLPQQGDKMKIEMNYTPWNENRGTLPLSLEFSSLSDSSLEDSNAAETLFLFCGSGFFLDLAVLFFAVF